MIKDSMLTEMPQDNCEAENHPQKSKQDLKISLSKKN